MHNETPFARAGTAAAWLGLLALAGCATDTLDRAPPAPDRPWHPATLANGEIVAGAASAAAPADGPRGYVLPSNSAVASLPSAPSVDPAHVYDLPELIDLAAASSPDTRIAWNDARNAALAAGIARSTFLPQIAATALGGYKTGHADDLSGRFDTSDTTLSGGVALVSLQWLLFDFGQRAARVEAADQATVIANIQFTAAHQRLIHDVSLAFYAYSAARARVSTTEQSLKDAQDVEAAAEDRFRHGIGTTIEVAQARQATAQNRLASVEAMGQQDDAYVDLLLAMGLPPLMKIAVADASGHPLSRDMVAPVGAFITAALARRPDVLAAYAAERASAANVKAARAEFKPKVFVSGNGAVATGQLDWAAAPAADGFPSSLNLSNRRFGATIMGGVTIPLFDGGRRRDALAQARLGRENAGLALDRVKNEAVRQIVLADNALRTSLSTYEAAGALLKASQITYDAALAAYRQGVGSSTDILTAEQRLLAARDAVTNAYSTSLSAAATLALATGSLGAAPR